MIGKNLLFSFSHQLAAAHGAEDKLGQCMGSQTVGVGSLSSDGLPDSTVSVYNWTGDHNYLVTARRAATYFLNTLPSDGIVPWYFLCSLR